MEKPRAVDSDASVAMLQTSVFGLAPSPLNASQCGAVYDLIKENRTHLLVHKS